MNVKKEMERIRRSVERDFPNDPALQQVHIARKIIAMEAKLKGFTFAEYVKASGKQGKDIG
ncbi:MAG: hypothetical protein ACE5IJ_09065 [Thermoplasmata archaeon]